MLCVSDADASTHYTSLISQFFYCFSVMEKTFKDYDKNADGLIVISEKLWIKLQEEAMAVLKLDLSVDRAKQFLSDADKNGDGKLSSDGILCFHFENLWFQFLKSMKKTIPSSPEFKQYVQYFKYHFLFSLIYAQKYVQIYVG